MVMAASQVLVLAWFLTLNMKSAFPFTNGDRRVRLLRNVWHRFWEHRKGVA